MHTLYKYSEKSGSEFSYNFLCLIRHCDLGHSGEWSLHGLAAPEFVSGNNGDCGIDTFRVLGSRSLQQNLSSPVFTSYPQSLGGPLVILLKSGKRQIFFLLKCLVYFH